MAGGMQLDPANLPDVSPQRRSGIRGRGLTLRPSGGGPLT